VATALGMQRHMRLKDIQDLAEDNGTLRDCLARAYSPEVRQQLDRHLANATKWGVVLGILLALLLNGTDLLNRRDGFTLATPWFVVMNTFLCVMFTRGLELTRSGGRATGKFIEQHLPIDLLRIDELSIVGRSAARTAAIWFAVSAVSCLFFISGLSVGAALGFILVCALIGVAMFVVTLDRLHRRIRAAKKVELARVRTQIDRLRHEAHDSADASLKLHGLIAYETRIASVHEWPFDQTTAMRLAASALILTVPWFGQALAQTLIDRIGQFVH
jgi:hypothetical protein